MRTLFFIAAVALAGAAQAQQRPYAGQQEREIKALSADEIKQYLAGAGMGYAKSAELNHYPGPGHALELAGARLVESERALEQLFRSGQVDEAALARAVRAAAQLNGEYRLSHLETHRRTRALLTAEQVARYDALRGYGGGTGTGHSRRH
jgi:hypothetical protein